MTNVRGWNVAFAGTLLLLALIVQFSDAAEYSPSAGALVTLGVIGVCYFTFGRLAFTNQAASVLIRIVIIVGCGVAVFFAPNMATLQALVFPFLWVLSGSTTVAIVLSAVLAASVGIGFAVGLGGSSEAVLQAVGIEGVSLLFAIVLGLWITRIEQDGEKHKRLLHELTAAQGELAALHREAGSSAEREHLAREIHDTIAQGLTSLVLLAQRARGELDTHQSGQAAENLELIETIARDTLTEARTLVVSMAPVQPPGSESSLGETLGRLAARFQQETGVQVDVTIDTRRAPARLGREREVVLLRSAQEGLANVRKHSQASIATLGITWDDEAATLSLVDNGRGLGDYSPQRENGFGLAGMRDRVGLVGGTLSVECLPGGGTMLTVTVPNIAVPNIAVPNITAPGVTVTA